MHFFVAMFCYLTVKFTSNKNAFKEMHLVHRL